jgi:hypothetical protein
MKAVLVSVAAVLVLAGCGAAARVSGEEHAAAVAAVEAPQPSNAKGHYNLDLTDVDCAAPGNCAAAGILDSNTISRGLLFVEKNGAWSVSEPPLPKLLRSGNKSSGLSSVACPAVGHCVAVGYAASGSQLVPLVLTQQTNGWKETVPGKEGSLDFVSCPTTGNCTAAGGPGQLLDETDGRWGTLTTAGLPPNGGTTTVGATPTIQSLSCWAAGNCAAVGVYGDKHGSPQGWLLLETGGVWARGVEAELPANASTDEGSYLYPAIELDVSCAPSGDCAAVGGYADANGGQFGMLLSEHAGRWSPAEKTPLPGNAGPNPQQGNAPQSPMGSVACPSAGKCSAVGWYLDDHGKYHGLLLDEGNGAWSPSEVVFPSGGTASAGASLDSVACPSAGNCLAVGTYKPTLSAFKPFVVDQRNGRWSKGADVPSPEGVGENYNGDLVSVSCASAKTCVAVGGHTLASGFQRGLIVTIGRG